ncbi:hypothetical protein ABEB36_014914 [Hypothenemus hampei]|uniref:Tetraspanin n=1 Tax=Hypothenemus hampei TaxID=57062 RepID=A0ABD1E1J9_HYPHA
MARSCSPETIKLFMYGFNLFFLISGIIVIAVGVAVKTKYTEYERFLDIQYFSLPNMLIATGAFIFMISFLGCYGTIRRSWIMLAIFTSLLCMIFIFEFASGIAGYVLRDKTANYLDETLRKNLATYNSDDPNMSTSQVWDLIQSSFQCCGVDHYIDWTEIFGSDLPISCCPVVQGTVGVFYCNSLSPTTATTTNPSSTPMPSDIPETTTSSDIPEITTSSDISEITTFSDIPETTTSSDISEITTFSDIPETTTPFDISETITSSDIPETTTTIKIIEPDNQLMYNEGTSSLTNASSAAALALISKINRFAAASDSQSPGKPFQQGCKSAFGDFVRKHAVQIGGWAFGLCAIQLLGIILSFHMTRQIKNGYYTA